MLFISSCLFPCCVVENKYRLYAPAKNDATPTIRAVRSLDLILDIKIIISPARLGVGGAAMLAAPNKNHHILNNGITVIPLRIKIILRVPIR